MTDYDELKKKAIKDTKEKVRGEKSRKDKLVARMVKFMDNLDDTSNVLMERFKDIYSLYFPELEKKTNDPDEYLELVSKLSERKNFTEEKVKEIVEDIKKAKNIERSASGSVGADLEEESLYKVTELSEMVLNMREERREVEEHVEKLMEKVAPNLKAVVGGVVGARLIAEAGSLKKLMSFPASTVQVLGAEKALFAHLERGVNPPKHGLIFQVPELRGAPREKRGKIARKIAGKASIASRIDYFNGEFRGDKMKEELENEIEEVLGE